MNDDTFLKSPRKFYTGIGSRKVPSEVGNKMIIISQFLEKHGYILRSGGAIGSDSYFEKGIHNPLHKEIYLPTGEITDDAIKLAKQYHPSWKSLSPFGKKLMARNGYQILGFDLHTPSLFVICWTKDGYEGINRSLDTGGSGQAINIAYDYGIPIFNLYNSNSIERLKELLTNIAKEV